MFRAVTVRADAFFCRQGRRRVPCSTSPMRSGKDIILDFVGVGAGRSGTTWLAACLAEHPEVCMSRPKELHYFSDQAFVRGLRGNVGKSSRWLTSRFAHGLPGQLHGEISPHYIMDPAVPAKLAAHNGQIKIIFTYRDPVDRLYSLFFQLARLYPVPPTFEGFLASSSAYLDSGYYAQQTAGFLRVFPREQLHFIFYDDIKQTPTKVLHDLFAFLGIDVAFSPQSSRARINERAAPRSIVLRDSLHKIRLLLNRNRAALAIKGALANIGVEQFYHFLRKVNLRATELPPMRPDTRSRIAAAYAEDVAELSRMTGRDLSQWLHSP
jgi:hypothetical protein